MSPKKHSATSSSKNISISGDVVDSVVITGDNNIVNYFKGEYVSLKEYYVSPDAVFQRVRTEDFVGREWLTAQVDAFLKDPQRKSGAFLLIGDAGVGKTSFMAHLVRERDYLHLFAEQAPGQAMLQRAIQSLASQLVTRYQIDPYKDRDTLIQGTVFPDFLERLLRMAASKLTGGEKIVIVCDALDEAGTFPDGNVFGLPNVLPDGVYLILSQRPVNVKLPNIEPLTVRLEAQGADNLGDMEKYLGEVSKRTAVADQLRAKNYSDAFFIQTLKEKSLGVWMYLHYVIKEIEAGSLAPLELSELPTGLVGYYAGYWHKWRMKNQRGEILPKWNNLYAPLLATLAAAQDAITVERLTQWAQVKAKPDEVKTLLGESWRAFVTEKTVGGKKVYAPYHLSFRDFITGKVDLDKLDTQRANLVRDLSERTVAAHARIVHAFEAECGGEWERLVAQEYPRLHLSAHLNGAGEYEKLRILLTEGEEKIKWAEAKEQKEETYAGYLNDLRYVWDYAERKQNYALAIRCMLIENSIHSLAENIPPVLLAELIKSGLWNYARGIDVIRQYSDSEKQASALNLLISEIPFPSYQEVIAIASGIENESTRARALSTLVPYLTEDLKAQVVDIGFEIKEAAESLNFFSAVIPHLENETKIKVTKRALLVARQLKLSNRAKSLSIFVPHLTFELKVQVIEEILGLLQYSFTEHKIDILSTIAPHLSEELKSKALSSIALNVRDGHGYEHIRILSVLIPQLSSDLKKQAIKDAFATVFRIKYTSIRAEALSIIASHLDREHQIQTLYDVLISVRQISNESKRVRIMLSIIPNFAGDLKEYLILESFDTFCAIKNESSRAYYLLHLTPYLNKTLKTHAIKIVLSIANEMLDEADRDKILSDLAPYLDNEIEMQVMEDVLAATLKIKDKSRCGYVLFQVALHLSDDIKKQTLFAAYQNACQVESVSERVYLLSLIAPHLTVEMKNQALKEALANTIEIMDVRSRSDSLIILASYLKNAAKDKVIQSALLSLNYSSKDAQYINAISNLIPQIEDDIKKVVIEEAIAITLQIKDAVERLNALLSIVPHLDPDRKTLLIERMLVTTRQITDGEIEVFFAIERIAPYLTDILIPQVLQSLNQHSKYNETWHVKTLSSITPYATEEIKKQILTEAFTVIGRITEKEDRVFAFVEILPCLENETKVEVLKESLETAIQIKNEDNRSYAVSTLLPYIEKYLKEQMLRAISIVHVNLSQSNIYNGPKTLSNMIPYMDKEFHENILNSALSFADTITDQDKRFDVLYEIVKHFDEVKKVKLLEAMLYLRTKYSSEKSALLRMWKDINFKGLDKNIISFAKFTSKENREEGLETMSTLTPALVHFSGEEIVPKLYCAIQDTARWWP